jgi:ionotropic glutamate receptor
MEQLDRRAFRTKYLWSVCLRHCLASCSCTEAFLNQGGHISFSNDPRLAEFHGGNLQFDRMSIFDGGKMLLSSILEVNISGVTGPIKFTSDGNLIGTAYEVINVIGTGISRIGYWSNSSGLSQMLNAQTNRSRSNNLYGVIWPGQTTQKPRGWVFSNNGRQLRVGVPVRINFREFVSRVDGSDTFHGYCIDVFTAALAILPYPVPYKFIPFGDGHINPVFTDLLYKITTGVSMNFKISFCAVFCVFSCLIMDFYNIYIYIFFNDRELE